MPEVAQTLPIPRELRDEGVQKYGFHGLSYEYVRRFHPQRTEGRTIIAHLGNGSSLVALRDGEPVDTTMGFTPCGGMMMGSRSGDLDPGVLVYLMERKGYSARDVEQAVNERSGLAGVSGVSGDVRELVDQKENPGAVLAVEMFCYHARKHIGGLVAVLGGLDNLIFTGGIGGKRRADSSVDLRGDAFSGNSPGLASECATRPANYCAGKFLRGARRSDERRDHDRVACAGASVPGHVVRCGKSLSGGKNSHDPTQDEESSDGMRFAGFPLVSGSPEREKAGASHKTSDPVVNWAARARRRSLVKLTAKDVMRTDVETVDANMALPDLEKAFLDRKVSGFAVESYGKLVGVVTQTDIVRKLCVERSRASLESDWYQGRDDVPDDGTFIPAEVRERMGVRIETLKVRDAMSDDPITVSPDTPLVELCQLLLGKRVHRVFVTEEDRLLGVVSSLDFVRLVGDRRVD